jgi:colanic acid/amylovoran biosynthesis glycosyltransferase
MTSLSDSRPRVAYILKMFPRFSETFILSEILELERTGVDVRVFSLKLPNDARRHADVDRVQAPITYLPEISRESASAYLRAHVSVLRRTPRRYLKGLSIATRRAVKGRRWSSFKRFIQAGYVGAHLQDEGIDHIHAHFASSATSVARDVNLMTGTSFSFTAHAKDIFIESLSMKSLVRKLQRARFVITVSDFNVRHLRSIEPTVNVHRIYNGLDLEVFAPAEPQPQDPPLVLSVGRLVEKKGFDDLIRAAAILRDRGVAFRVEIVGTGSEEGTLRALIAEHNLENTVRLTGAMPREELIGLLPKASVFPAPCVIGTDGNRDGLPTVLIEAMALGVPVISTPVTGIPELVRHDETGVIVPEHDPAALADAIETALTHPQRAREMADAGRQLVEKEFDLRENVAQIRQLFQEASVK